MASAGPAPTADRLEVWGDPVAHSLSPALHRAAYAQLGHDWSYERRQVTEESFAGELAGLGRAYRGLSCTMPLKAQAYRAAAWRDTRAELTGAVDTLLLTEAGIRGFNTDIGGIVRAFADAGITSVDDVRIVGTGATATSALVAAAELGARHVEVVGRRPEAAAALVALGEHMAVTVTAVPLAASAYLPRTVTIATLPGGVEVDAAVCDALAAAGGFLMDVVYARGRTPLERAWGAAGLPHVDGAGMLLHQAVLQVRVFTTGDVSGPLPDEASVVAVMRRALMED